MSNLAMSIESVSKQYRLGLISSGTVSHDLNRWWARVRGKPDPLLKVGGPNFANREGEYIWALRDVSLQIKQGEVLGIIGHNGAGKSTLLKILSRVTAPTTGQIKLKGRVASLLEVGTGFHPELTGRENIRLNGAILGMTKAETKSKFDEIVAFAEVEKFVDTPVKRYSSGMYVRLAFAVAAHLDPDILIVDEVLAVGDIGFQEKCLGKMGDVAREGRTILFVSHNLNAVWSLCPKAAWLDGGQLEAIGPAEDIINSYRNSTMARQLGALDTSSRGGSGKVRIMGINCQDPSGNSLSSITTGQSVSFVLEYTSQPGAQLDDLEVNLIVSDEREVRLIVLTNRASGDRFMNLPRKGLLKCFVPEIPLLPGQYSLTFSCSLRKELADKAVSIARFVVTEGDYYGSGWLPDRSLGVMLGKHKWSIEAI